METEQYEWGWCSLCDTLFVYCPKCGNNTCNGGSGKLENGGRCDKCEEAYAFHDKCIQDKTTPDPEIYKWKKFTCKNCNKDNWFYDDFKDTIRCVDIQGMLCHHCKEMEIWNYLAVPPLPNSIVIIGLKTNGYRKQNNSSPIE